MKKILSTALTLTLTVALFSGCTAATGTAAGTAGSAQNGSHADATPAGQYAAASQQSSSGQASASQQTNSGQTSPAQVSGTPKYVFLFIGDGMSFPQFQSAADYLGALADSDYMDAAPSLEDNHGAVLDGPVALNFMEFDTVGSVVTYDSNSFAPDSASTATSISTGHKTYSGSINVDETATISYETITEKVHEQLGMKVGVISSVNLNHATPAAFYAQKQDFL